MSSTADLVLENIYWRVESTDPSFSGRPFTPTNPTALTPEDMAQAERLYWVDWLDEDYTEEGVDDITERIRTHHYELRMVYSHSIDHRRRQRMALSDRHDILTTLRDSDNWTGYEAGNSATDIGLWGRVITHVERTDDIDGADTMLYSIECTIKESEI